MSNSNKAWYFVPAIALLVTFARPAHGYIDSGTGSYLIQAVMAGALAASFFAKNLWNLLRSKFIKRPIPRDEN